MKIEKKTLKRHFFIDSKEGNLQIEEKLKLEKVEELNYLAGNTD